VVLDGDRETAVGLLLRVDELVEANQRLVEANGRLEARVAELERRLSRSSRSSSLPPSQDPPSAPPRPRGKGSGRKQGGQQGHEGRYRRLLPPEQVDEIVEYWPDRCRSCAYEFVEVDRVEAAEPSRRQVSELPPIAVRVSEHRLHRVCCPECAAVTATEPAAGSRWAFGPRLQAAVVTLAVRNRVSRRDTTELARELFGVEISTGTVDAIIQRAGEALVAPLAWLRLPRPQPAAALLGAPAQGLHRPQRGDGRTEDLRRGRPADRAQALRLLAELPGRRRPYPATGTDRHPPRRAPRAARTRSSEKTPRPSTTAFSPRAC
jgi:Family of unknown function (DUF6444)